MKKLFTDAGFTWQDSEKVPMGGQIMGKICVSDGEGFERVEMVGVGKVPDLKQYINIFELIAIARAVEMAIEKGWVGSLAIFTDSRVARVWASNGIKREKLITRAHAGALAYLATARKNYGGIITYNQIPRDSNPAGHRLEAELERERARIEDKEDMAPVDESEATLDPFAGLDA